MKIQNALVLNIPDRSQRYFAHVTTVTLSWRVQNIVVIGRVYFTLECFEFSSNFEFDRNMLSGTGAWWLKAPCMVSAAMVLILFARNNLGPARQGLITTHLLSIERVDWPKLHDMFKARDANTWQLRFPVGFLVRVCALYLLFFSNFHDVVACIESGRVIKARYVFLLCKFVFIAQDKPALELKRSRDFSRAIRTN